MDIRAIEEADLASFVPRPAGPAGEADGGVRVARPGRVHGSPGQDPDGSDRPLKGDIHGQVAGNVGSWEQSRRREYGSKDWSDGPKSQVNLRVVGLARIFTGRVLRYSPSQPGPMTYGVPARGSLTGGAQQGVGRQLGGDIDEDEEGFRR